MTADVVVIGAGCAGLSAAVRLSEAGRRVVVVEALPRLGGRASAFTDRVTGERVDNGQHVLFGCYRETYALLDRIGATASAPLQPRMALTMRDATGHGHRLTCAAVPPPWHLVIGLARWSALTWRDRLSAGRIARVLLAARRQGPAAAASAVDPRQTVSAWLDAHGQSRRLVDWLWRPLALAALNQTPETAAAAPFVRVLAELFGPRAEDSAIGVPIVPLDELYAEPAARFILARGGAVLRQRRARIALDARGRIVGVDAGAERIDTTTVVSAVPWHALDGLWHDAPPAPLARLLDTARRIENSPIVTTHLWLDRRVMHEPLIGLVGTRTHWFFDGAGRTTAPYRVTAVVSGASELVAMDNRGVCEAVMGDLRRALPDAGGARLVHEVVVRERRATFSLAPGGPGRPGPRTALQGFYLAGDWTDTGLPATIESGILSGRLAAIAARGLPE